MRCIPVIKIVHVVGHRPIQRIRCQLYPSAMEKAPNNYVCRTCLGEDMDEMDTHISAYATEIQNLFGLELIETPYYPEKICRTCKYKIKDFYQYKKKVIANQEKIYAEFKPPKKAPEETPPEPPTANGSLGIVIKQELDRDSDLAMASDKMLTEPIEGHSKMIDPFVDQDHIPNLDKPKQEPEPVADPVDIDFVDPDEDCDDSNDHMSQCSDPFVDPFEDNSSRGSLENPNRRTSSRNVNKTTKYFLSAKESAQLYRTMQLGERKKKRGIGFQTKARNLKNWKKNAFSTTLC